MQKRHGLIIEKAIFEAVSLYDHFTVWKEETFKVLVRSIMQYQM